MRIKKNYLRQYDEKCFEKVKNPCSLLNLIIVYFFIFFIVTSLIICFYIIIFNQELDDIGENSTKQTFSIKKKKLRTDFSTWNKNCDWNLILVNNNNNVPEFFDIELTNYGDIDIDKRIVSNLNEMIQDAAQNNVILWVSSGYRSLERQKQLFDKTLESNIKNGLSKDDAFKLAIENTSLPGHNEHNLGISVDFNAMNEKFENTSEYNWLINNASRYGFILRYPKDKMSITGRAFEPDHFRYVGEEAAALMKEKNLCLEEYISELIK